MIRLKELPLDELNALWTAVVGTVRYHDATDDPDTYRRETYAREAAKARYELILGEYKDRGKIPPTVK